MTVAQELDQLTTAIKTISKERNYWLVRLLDPDSYKNAVNRGILEYKDLIENSKFFTHPKLDWYFFIDKIKNAPSYIQTKKQLEKYFDNLYVNEQIGEAAITTGIINDFYLSSKLDDIILLVDDRIANINIGFIMPDTELEQEIEDVSINDYEVLGSTKVEQKIKHVNWVKLVNHKRFHFHNLSFLEGKFEFSKNVVTNIKEYSEEIESLFGDMIFGYYMTTYIVRVNKIYDIDATELFGFGNLLLEFIDLFSREHDLGLNSKDLKVSIVLNSPGIIKFKSRIKSLSLLAALIVLVAGGGYENKEGTSFKTPGLFKCLDEFLTHKQEREIKADLFRYFKDSLKIKDSDELLRLIKQFSENKDIPK